MDLRPSCLLQPKPDTRLFQPRAEDILSDEELLELFRIIKQIIRRRPDAERMAKVVFCIFYSLGDHVKCYRPAHDDTIIFRDDLNPGATLNAVRVSHNPSCCDITPTQQTTTATTTEESTMGQHWKDISTDTPKPLSVSYLTSSSPKSPSTTIMGNNDNLSTQSSDNHHFLSTNNNNNNNDNHNIPTDPILNPFMSNTSPSGLMLLDHTPQTTTNDIIINSDHDTAVRPYSHFRPLYSLDQVRFDERHESIDYTHQHVREPPSSQPLQPIRPSPISPATATISPNVARYQQLNSMLHGPMTNTRIQPDPATDQIVMEPKQRGFYYQYGRIDREPPLLRRFAEQGVLTQASLLRKRKRQCSDSENPYVLTTLPAPAKKPKIPHRHGEFEQRRDDIIHRMRSITMMDLEQKSQRLAHDSTLAIEQADLPLDLQVSSITPEDAAELLEPSLRILTLHSNMKPHLDNGMNQNGIYYNSDYYRLYLAFIQFQKVFATLFPQEVVKIRNIVCTGDGDDEYDPLAIPLPPSCHAPNVSAMSERDRDRDRNMNMKAYRGWIEPLLTETNWAAFRRNIVVGERMVLLTKVVGQGVLLMTKELSGSKLHLTFTNSEWDEFIGGLFIGKWDETVHWDDDGDDSTVFWGSEKSRLVDELKTKFLSSFWFYENGTVVPPQIRKRAQEQRKQERAEEIRLQKQQRQTQAIESNDVTSPSSSSLVSDVPTTTTSTTASTTATDTIIHSSAGQVSPPPTGSTPTGNTQTGTLDK
ncbi:hypothetical protein BC941DRAFT_432765 [Chlamydoabsidia padenii]|nr:hypothetical protein BC941DRAFT_432765 [Chlamydoabsidia padenii]